MGKFTDGRVFFNQFGLIPNIVTDLILETYLTLYRYTFLPLCTVP